MLRMMSDTSLQSGHHDGGSLDKGLVTKKKSRNSLLTIEIASEISTEVT